MGYSSQNWFYGETDTFILQMWALLGIEGFFILSKVAITGLAAGFARDSGMLRYAQGIYSL